MGYWKQLLVQYFQAWVFPAVLLFLLLVLCFANYVPGTWLSGWDTLHPEFNFGLYFQRSFFAAWQETYGLGAPSIQAFAAELPRLILIYPLSFFVPASDLRYVYWFLTVILGGYGMYFFVAKVVFGNKRWWKTGILGFLAGLLYILNPGALQIFALPFEMNITFYATFPWLLMFATKFINDHKRLSLILFCITTFFAAPMAHTPTLFVTYFLFLVIYIGIFSFISHQKLKAGFVLVILTLIINSFWLLPAGYFVLTKGNDVANSKINLQFSGTLTDSETKVGTLANTVLLKNIFFDWGEYSIKEHKFIPLLQNWQDHVGGIPFKVVGYALFAISLLGIVVSIRKKNHVGLALLPGFIGAFMFLANDQWPFNWTVGFIGWIFPLTKELFRFTLTKFMTLMALPFVVYFAIGVNFIALILKERLFIRIKMAWLGILLIGSILIIFYMYPAFLGGFLDQKMRVTFPSEYFQTTKWLNEQEGSGRVATFPVQSFWAWQYYGWNYEGAGFWWFGLEKPSMDREFDRWSSYNENYYWQISKAVYSQNIDELEKILRKYDIQWLIVDENIIDPTSPKSLYFEELDELLLKSKYVVPVGNFGKIKIYKDIREPKINNFVGVGKNLISVNNTLKRTDSDAAYDSVGDYVSSDSPDYYYPFRSLLTRSETDKFGFMFKDNGNNLDFISSHPQNIGEYIIETELTEDDPRVFIDQNNITVSIPKASTNEMRTINPATHPLPEGVKNCNARDVKGELEVKIVDRWLELESKNANNCSAYYDLPQQATNQAFLVSFAAKNITGNTMQFWVENTNSRRVDQQTKLQGLGPNGDLIHYFVQPPMEQYGLGYTLHFDNVSIGEKESLNQLGEIKIYQIPYEFLTNLRFKKFNKIGDSGQISTGQLKPVKINPTFYKVDTGLGHLNSGDSLYLSQAYDPGWLAVDQDFLFLQHELINGWANGWKLSGTERSVYILFWPQLLEFGGFAGILIAVFLFIVKRTKDL